MAAGIGCRKQACAVDLVAVVDAALAEYALSRAALSMLAVLGNRAAMPAVKEAAETLGLPLVIPDMAALDHVRSGLLTHSDHSFRATGFGSASEAAAMAAAGPGAHLLGPRVARGQATCAIARGVTK